MPSTGDNLFVRACLIKLMPSMTENLIFHQDTSESTGSNMLAIEAISLSIQDAELLMLLTDNPPKLNATLENALARRNTLLANGQLTSKIELDKHNWTSHGLVDSPGL